MNEKIKLYVILAVIVLFSCFAFMLVKMNDKFQKDVYEQFTEIFNGEKNTLIYIGRPDCPYCALLDPSMDDISIRYKFDYFYINVNEVNSNVMEKIIYDLNAPGLGTPFLAIVSNGKMVDYQNGYADYDVIFEFLKKNGIISFSSKLLLNYIDYDEYISNMSSDKLSVTVVGKSDCGYSVDAKIILNKLVEDTNADINYLNLSYLKEEEYNKVVKGLQSALGDWGTPTMIITKDGKIIDILSGLASYEDYYSFLKGYGVI